MGGNNSKLQDEIRQLRNEQTANAKKFREQLQNKDNSYKKDLEKKEESYKKDREADAKAFRDALQAKETANKALQDAQIEQAKKNASKYADEIAGLRAEMKAESNKMQTLQDNLRKQQAEELKLSRDNLKASEAEKQEAQRKTAEATRNLEEANQNLASKKAEMAKAKEELKKAQQKEDDLKTTLHMFSSGISPVLWPTAEEIQKAKNLLGPNSDDYYHIAVAGYTGTGKSSIINAFRGVKNNNKTHAASVGVTETTTGLGRYPDPTPDGPRSKFVWYDVPGCGTLLKPGPQYFNDHGLFIFDIIIILFGDRFSQQDLAILEHCSRFKVPTFLVRSKSNQYIDNIIQEELDHEGPQSGPEFEQIYQQAREIYMRETSQSVRNNLALGEFHDPNQKVYHVSAMGMRAYVNNVPESNLSVTSRWLDEPELIKNIAKTIVRRRFDPESLGGESELEAKLRDAINLAKTMCGGSKKP